MKKNNSLASFPNASWAHKAGISKENNGAFAFGLNPNLNIEDEYIENLLKQVHFMTMEIKLLKEKQQESNGNSLWGIINRTSQPLVKNIVDSNQKYQTMKKQVDTDLNTTQYENIKLADQQNAVIKKMNYLQKKLEQLQRNRKDQEGEGQTKQEKIKDKITEHQNKLKAVMAEKEAQLRKGMELNDQLEATMSQIEKQKFYNGNQMQRIKNDEDIEQALVIDKQKQIDNLKSKIEKIKLSIQNSQQFQRAKEDQMNIRDNMEKVNKNISSAQFEMLQVTETIKLAEKQREKQILERKKYMEEYESLKNIIKEIKALNDTRTNQQIQNRKRESMDIQKGQYQTKKLQKNLDQTKKKLLRSEESQKSLKQQVQHMERQLAKVKSKRDEINQIVNKMISENDRQQTTLSNCRNQYRKVYDQYQKVLNSQLNSNCDLNDIQTEITFLRSRKDYLSEVLNLKETLNQTKVQQLQKMVQKNKDVNQTVGVLMEKWEEIRSFSKM